MSANNINLATIGSAELDAMPVGTFVICLRQMSNEAIARFAKMRKLGPVHRQALDHYLANKDTPEGNPVRRKRSSAYAKPSLRMHLYAWWNGIDVSQCSRQL